MPLRHDKHRKSHVLTTEGGNSQKENVSIVHFIDSMTPAQIFSMSEHEEVHIFIITNIHKEQSDKEKDFRRKQPTKGFEAALLRKSRRI